MFRIGNLGNALNLHIWETLVYSCLYVTHHEQNSGSRHTHANTSNRGP
jgi:hypothetical protein